MISFTAKQAEAETYLHQSVRMVQVIVLVLKDCRSSVCELLSAFAVRLFDLRHLEHSTIIYEDAAHTPLLRLAWNKQVKPFPLSSKIN